MNKEEQKEILRNLDLLLQTPKDWELDSYIHSLNATLNHKRLHIELWMCSGLIFFELYRPTTSFKIPFFKKLSLWRKANKIYSKLLTQKREKIQSNLNKTLLKELTKQ